MLRIISLLISQLFFCVQVFSQRWRKPGYLENQVLQRPEAGGSLANATFSILDVDTYIAETEVQKINLIYMHKQK